MNRKSTALLSKRFRAAKFSKFRAPGLALTEHDPAVNDFSGAWVPDRGDPDRQTQPLANLQFGPMQVRGLTDLASTIQAIRF